MAKARLTSAFAASACCQPGRKRTDFWDSGPGSVPGLVLEVRSSGQRTWYLRYLDPGTKVQRQLKLAGYLDAPFEEVKRVAKRLRADIVLGGDPVGRKKERPVVPTYATLADQHIEEAKRTQRSWWSTEGIIRNRLVPKFGKMRLDEITPQEISKWLAEKAAEGLAPSTVEKYRIVLGRSFELARRWEIPGGEKNVVRLVQKQSFENSRQRYLSAAEAQRLKWACELSAQKQLKHIVGLLLLTGARKSELLNAKWEHVDLERRLWFIPQTKNGRSRHVPLSQAAVDIINAVPRLKGCPYLIGNLKTGKPFVSIKRAWQKAIEEADLPGLRIHDLRHSAASFMINAGIDLYAVGKVLGHLDSASTRRYSHLADATLQAAVTAGAAKLNVGWAEPTK